jgi:cbb3-type cytochrome oxidase subunit 3
MIGLILLAIIFVGPVLWIAWSARGRGSDGSEDAAGSSWRRY